MENEDSTTTLVIRMKINFLKMSFPMSRRFTLGMISTLLAVAFTSTAFAGGTITWPSPPLPAGANPAATPTPKIEWFDRFQTLMDNAKKMPKIDLIFDGDSITERWGSTGSGVWKDHYANLNAFNFGIGGDQIQHLLWRLQNGQVDGLHQKLIVLLIGANNLVGTPDQIAGGIKAIVAEYQNRCPEAVILLQAIFPRGEQPNTPLREKFKAANQMISQFADGKKVIYLDIGDKLVQSDGTISKDVMVDFTHPTAKGYQIWADAIQSTIDKFVPPNAAQPKQ